MTIVGGLGNLGFTEENASEIGKGDHHHLTKPSTKNPGLTLLMQAYRNRYNLLLHKQLATYPSFPEAVAGTQQVSQKRKILTARYRRRTAKRLYILCKHCVHTCKIKKIVLPVQTISLLIFLTITLVYQRN